MAQLTIYIDSETRQRVEAAARLADVSVSHWIKQRLTDALESEWPDRYFELFGSLDEGDLERPEQPPITADTPREPL